MPDRLAEIRARLDTGHKDRGVSCCRASQNHDRLAEIRGMLSDEERTQEIRDRLDEGGPVLSIDVRWLLDEVERLAARVRMYEEVKS